MKSFSPYQLLFAAFVASFVIYGCAAGRRAHDTITDAVPVPPIHVVASKKKDTSSFKIDAYDAEELFRRATVYLRDGNCPGAIGIYQKLETEFASSELLEPALYNRGVCLDNLGKFNEAILSYRALIHRFPESNDLKATYFRLAHSLEKLEAWNEMITVLEELEQKKELLSALDKVEIHAKKGAALIEAGKPAMARFALESAIRIFMHDKSISATAPDYYYSMAQFKLAEIVHSEMRQITLPTDDKKLGDILEKKCQLLLDSQFLYTKVIRIGHPHWSAAAAYRTGALYHHLWEDMLSAPSPKGLTEEEQKIYKEVLRKRIKILLQKAVKQWRRTIKLAMRLNLDNAWITRTKADLKQIEAMLEIEEQVGVDLPIE